MNATDPMPDPPKQPVTQTAAEAHAKSEEDALSRARAIISEAFPAYLITVQGNDGPRVCYSHRAFAVGMAAIVDESCREQERIFTRQREAADGE